VCGNGTRAQPRVAIRSIRAELGPQSVVEHSGVSGAADGLPLSTPVRAAETSPQPLGGSPARSALASCLGSLAVLARRSCPRHFSVYAQLSGGEAGVPDQTPVQRRLAAILAGDVVGYSRLMGADEVGTLNALKTIRRELADPAIAAHHGRVVKTTGDGILIEFPSVVDAVACAVVIQDGKAARNVDVPEAKRIVFRIGINIGDIIIDEADDIHGDGVNVAARLEGLAQPGGICISLGAYDQVRGKLDVAFEDMGEQSLKNIAQPVRVYRLIKQLTRATSSPSSATSGQPERPSLPLPDKPSLAVLPFQNMSGDPEQEYFADGLSEDIITALSRMHSLFVIARNSSFTYKGRAIDVKQVGRDLGVRYILEGSVRKSGSRIRVTGQLIDAMTGRHIWAEKYDRELIDIFDIQDEITRAVAASVQTQVEMFEGEIVDRERIDVWGLVKRAWRRLLDLDTAALEEAKRLAEEALRLDPNSARAHAVLSVALEHLVEMRGAPDERQERVRARDLALTAIRLDDRDEFSHWALGNACTSLGESDQAIAAYRRALELNPNFALAYGLLGTALAYAGEPEESIKATEVAIRSNPRDPSIFFRYSGLAMAHFIAGEFDEAVGWARKSIDRKREWHRAHLLLIASLSCSGRLEEARSAVAAYLRLFPQGSSHELDRIALKFPEHKERLRQALRAAGLPE
jgi:adenylate cyclase